jgi:hypothetical protein
MKDFVTSFRRTLQPYTDSSVLAWSAAMRACAILPLVLLLWLAVWWATLEAVPL